MADFLELAELMCTDARTREGSCGADFRVEHQDDGEALRDDGGWARVSAWATRGTGAGGLTFTRYDEPLAFDAVPLATSGYR